MSTAELAKKKIADSFRSLSAQNGGMDLANIRYGIFFKEEDKEKQTPVIDLWLKVEGHGLIPAGRPIEGSDMPEKIFLSIDEVIYLSAVEKGGICMMNGVKDAYAFVLGGIKEKLHELSKENNVPLETIRVWLYMKGEGENIEAFLFNDTEPVCPIELEKLI